MPIRFRCPRMASVMLAVAKHMGSARLQITVCDRKSADEALTAALFS
jgi:hypothetical protein